MVVKVNETGAIQLEKVFNGVVFRSDDGEMLCICMRDSGFEFNYNGKWYSAKEGVLTVVTKNSQSYEM